MKPQLEPVCGHLPLPSENKVMEWVFNVFLENAMFFMGVTCPHTKWNKTGFRLDLYK